MAFIVFEGLDGAGKSSLIQSLSSDLKKRDLDYIVTREPGGTELGDELRSILLRTEGAKPLAKAEALIYQAIRAQHVEEKILPSLKNNKWVICDRYTASSIAFQSGGRSISTSDIEWLNAFSTSGLEPDLFVLLDLPVEESLKRIEKRVVEKKEKKDRFELEKKDFHQKVRSTYLEIAKSNPNKWIILDAQKSPQEVYKDLFSRIKDKF